MLLVVRSSLILWQGFLPRGFAFLFGLSGCVALDLHPPNAPVAKGMSFHVVMKIKGRMLSNARAVRAGEVAPASMQPHGEALAFAHAEEAPLRRASDEVTADTVSVILALLSYLTTHETANA
jgi:hypothetical protein